MSSSPTVEQTAPAGDVVIEAPVLIADMIRIADGVGDKDKVPVAKLRIEVRQWVIESYLLKTARKAGGDEAREVIAVNIHTSADFQENASQLP